MQRPKIIVVTGPTASGKTSYAIRLALELGGEIVSADSMQVYRLLDIGTAKPSVEERRTVPHHLVDVVDPDEPFHVGRYRASASAAIAGILSRAKVPVVAGGTALYLKVLLRGLVEGPARDEELRRSLNERWDAGEGESLYGELRRVDPDLAARLHPHDRARITRGLEVWRLTGRRLSEAHARHAFGEGDYDALVLGMEVGREELCGRIGRRVLEMIDAGWIDEVRGVLNLGYSPDLPPLRSIGYRQLCRHLLRQEELTRGVAEIQTETRRFAKRQMTWFRRMPVEWVEPDDVGRGAALAKNFLQTPASPI